jgi:hypothetical protein
MPCMHVMADADAEERSKVGGLQVCLQCVLPTGNSGVFIQIEVSPS